MAQTSVSQFASELKMPAASLLEQLAKAGVGKKGETDLLSDADKTRLLDYLRKSHGATESKSKITLTRKTVSEIKVQPDRAKLRTAAARLSVVRAARGGTSAFFREEASVRLDADTREPTGIVTRGETSAHRLVERLMVAANEAVASWLIDRGLPALFRVHDQPDRERVETLAELARNSGFEPGFAETLTPLGLAAFEAQYRGTSVEPAMRTA